jgi:hypothetical protein
MLEVKKIGWLNESKTRFIVEFTNGQEIHKDTFLEAKAVVRRLIFKGEVSKESWEQSKVSFK